jgi:hypothetical protein
MEFGYENSISTGEAMDQSRKLATSIRVRYATLFLVIRTTVSIATYQIAAGAMLLLTMVQHAKGQELIRRSCPGVSA